MNPTEELGAVAAKLREVRSLLRQPGGERSDELRAELAVEELALLIRADELLDRELDRVAAS